MGRALALVTTLCVLSAASSWQDAGAADPEDLIRRGVELRRKEKDAEALILFQQAYDLNQSPKAMAQIGLAEQAIGRWGAADRHLRTALQASDDSWVVKHRKTIGDALEAIGQHVGRLDVRGNPPGAVVRVDGEVVGRLPLGSPVAVTAGGVAVEVRADGYVPILRASTVPIGMLIRETFDLQALSPAAATTTAGPPPMASPATNGAYPNPDDRLQAMTDVPSAPATAPAAPAATDSVRPMIALGLTGLAVGALAVGVVEHVGWQNKVAEFDRTTGCDPNAYHHGSAKCDTVWADAINARTGAFIGYGASAALVVTAAILYLTAPASGSNGRQVACAVNPLEKGASCSARF